MFIAYVVAVAVTALELLVGMLAIFSRRGSLFTTIISVVCLAHSITHFPLSIAQGSRKKSGLTLLSTTGIRNLRPDRLSNLHDPLLHPCRLLQHLPETLQHPRLARHQHANHHLAGRRLLLRGNHLLAR